MPYYSETVYNAPPEQRKYNGDYGFGFVATADETEAGTLIIRGGLVGFSNRPVAVGELGTAEIQGTITLKKAAATVFEQGDVAAWNTTTNLVVPATTVGAVIIGVVKFDPSAGAESVEVLLNYTPREVVPSP